MILFDKLTTSETYKWPVDSIVRFVMLDFYNPTVIF